MCLALYIFTNDTIPKSQWDKERPGIFVRAVDDGDAREPREWPHTQKHIYYIGSYQGCGCGWFVVSEEDEPADAQAKARDRLELGRIVRSVEKETTWLVACWEGDQGQAMKPLSEITIEQIEDPLFEFSQLQQYAVASPRAPSDHAASRHRF